MIAILIVLVLTIFLLNNWRLVLLIAVVCILCVLCIAHIGATVPDTFGNNSVYNTTTN